MKNRLVTFLLVQLFSTGYLGLHAQSPVWEGGIRIQKSIGLYWENGFTAHYSSPKILHEQMHIGAAYYSSRLGTAIGSNAIKQDNFVLLAQYLFRRSKFFQPFVGIQTGYFTADYENKLFDVLDHSSAIMATEFGLSYKFTNPLRMQFAFGYNLIHGNGDKGVGTLYPYYLQTTLLWSFIKK